jgi:CubicO group peptidase (beta-lactamase class C family)
MKNLARVFIAVVILGSSTYAQSDADARVKRVEGGLLPPVLVKGERSWSLHERMRNYKVPGVSIAVINQFKMEWAKAYGVKDAVSSEPVTETTLFQAASISKTLNATVIMKRVMEGRLSLDEDVNEYLTSWRLPDNEFTAKKKVTIAHLLSHTGGTTVSGFPGYDVTAPLPSVQQILKGEPPANTGPIVVNTAPGVRFRYSGGGITILQLVLTELDRKPYAQVLKETVLDPLKMVHSTFSQPLPDDWKSMAATGHRPEDKPVEGKFHVYPEQAAAGLWTTPTDLASFAIEHQLSVQGKSNRILSKEMEEKMMASYIGEGYGLGFGIQTMGDAVYFQHSGGNEGFSCLLIAHKDKGYGAVVMTNGNAYAIIPEIIRSIAKEYQWENYLPPPYDRYALAPETLKRIVGRYQFDSDGTITVRNVEGRLMADVTRMATTEIVPIAQDEFITAVDATRCRFMAGPSPDRDTLNIRGGGGMFKAYRIGEDQKVPYEYLQAGAIEEAVNRYKAIKKAAPSDPVVQESRLNALGYEFLRQNKLKEAIALFTLNTELYSQSPNVWDSLGEAYANTGDKELAIKNYKKSLELNPKNQGAEAAIKKLQK